MIREYIEELIELIGGITGCNRKTAELILFLASPIIAMLLIITLVPRLVMLEIMLLARDPNSSEEELREIWRGKE